MQAIDLDGWEAFETKLHECGFRNPDDKSYWLFRGQRESAWSLQTTLERASRKGLLVAEYCRIIERLRREIQTQTGAVWDLPEFHWFEQLLQTFTLRRGMIEIKSALLDYMHFLRDHGFPSPLLDWSRSPYVAAFFAFRERAGSSIDGPPRSIYAYRTPGLNSQWRDDRPSVLQSPHNVGSTKRHFLQQCAYTMALGFEDPAGWRFVDHEDVMQPNRMASPWTPLDGVGFKFNLPGSERERVLRLLDEHNLNAYSLFHTDDTFIETMAMRALDLT